MVIIAAYEKKSEKKRKENADIRCIWKIQNWIFLVKNAAHKKDWQSDYFQSSSRRAKPNLSLFPLALGSSSAETVKLGDGLFSLAQRTKLCSISALTFQLQPGIQTIQALRTMFRNHTDFNPNVLVTSLVYML